VKRNVLFVLKMNAAPAAIAGVATEEETTANLHNQNSNMDNDDDEPQPLPFCFVRVSSNYTNYKVFLFVHFYFWAGLKSFKKLNTSPMLSPLMST